MVLKNFVQSKHFTNSENADLLTETPVSAQIINFLFQRGKKEIKNMLFMSGFKETYAQAQCTFNPSWCDITEISWEFSLQGYLSYKLSK